MLDLACLVLQPPQLPPLTEHFNHFPWSGYASGVTAIKNWGRGPTNIPASTTGTPQASPASGTRVLGSICRDKPWQPCGNHNGMWRCAAPHPRPMLRKGKHHETSTCAPPKLLFRHWWGREGNTNLKLQAASITSPGQVFSWHIKPPLLTTSMQNTA